MKLRIAASMLILMSAFAILGGCNKQASEAEQAQAKAELAPPPDVQSNSNIPENVKNMPGVFAPPSKSSAPPPSGE